MKHLLVLVAILLGFGLLVAGIVAWADDSGDSGRGGESPTGLVGPVWEWEEFLGGDDSVVTPDDPSVYTIQFAEDGSVSVQADCNRAFGTYEADDDGSLVIEVSGVTQAACPPGSLSDRFLQDLGFVRTYVIEDGKLFLNLMADAGDMRFSSA